MKPYFVITDKEGTIKRFIKYDDRGNKESNYYDRFDSPEQAITHMEQYNYYNCFICKVEPAFYICAETITRRRIDPLL